MNCKKEIKKMNISLLDNNIIEDSNGVIKIMSEDGIKLFNTKVDAIRNINPAKVYDKYEALKFISSIYKDNVINGSERAINTFNDFIAKWKNN